MNLSPEKMVERVYRTLISKMEAYWTLSAIFEQIIDYHAFETLFGISYYYTVANDWFAIFNII